MQKIKRIAFFAHIGMGNLGDEATMATVVHGVRLRQPDAEICAFTLNPADTHERHHVTAFPIRYRAKQLQSMVRLPPEPKVANEPSPSPGIAARAKNSIKRIPFVGVLIKTSWNCVTSIPKSCMWLCFLLTSFRRLKGIDRFIITGGGQLGDYFGGPWGFPFTILVWCMMARMRGAKVIFISNGAGPIRSALSARFFRRALGAASYRSFRDQHSYQVIQGLNIRGENRVFPDLAHSLEVPKCFMGSSESVRRVGINPLPFHDRRYWAQDSPDIYKTYISKLADFAVWLMDNGYGVVLFPTQVVADPPVIEDIMSIIRNRLPALPPELVSCPAIETLDDLFAAIAETDLVVASRFHGVVISLRLGRPTIGLSYDPKTNHLLTDVGLGDSVRDISQFEVTWLKNQFRHLESEADGVRHQIETRTAEFRLALENQYDRLLGNGAVNELAGTVATFSAGTSEVKKVSKGIA